ncbi:DUF892 family protein [Trinickia sp. YCB016]
MSTERQELLCLLRNAYTGEQGAAALLIAFLERHPQCGQISAAIEAFLEQTLEHQRLLAECLGRIEENSEVQEPQRSDFSTSQRLEDPPEDDVLRELAHLLAFILQEIELYSSVIATAEASGLFETRSVCEGVQSDKSSMAAWLEVRTSSKDQLRGHGYGSLILSGKSTSMVTPLANAS